MGNGMRKVGYIHECRYCGGMFHSYNQFKYCTQDCWDNFHEEKSGYMPSPEEIARMCAVIQRERRGNVAETREEELALRGTAVLEWWESEEEYE